MSLPTLGAAIAWQNDWQTNTEVYVWPWFADDTDSTVIHQGVDMSA